METTSVPLEYTKTILSKVSFDKELFQKELLKAFSGMRKIDVIRLKYWALDNYYLMALPVIISHTW